MFSISRFRCVVAAIFGIAVLSTGCRTKVDQSRSEPSADQIDAGEVAFYDAACWRCHSLGDAELPGNPDFENQGPDLASVGERLDSNAILQSIVEPNSAIAEPKTDHVDDDGNSRMPSFSDTLPRETIEKIVAFLSAKKSTDEFRGTVDLTIENFEHEVLDADGLVMLDFWAEWCVPCHEIDPVLEKLAPEYRGRVKICKINVDDNPDLVMDYVPDNIFPCLILMKNGKLLDRQYGTDPKMEIEPFFRKWFTNFLTSPH